MKLFITWSGDRSKQIAEVLRNWLPSVLQAVKPYFSPDDMAKGSRWSSEIARELQSSSVGLLVVTPENQEASWLLFEAGALAQRLDRSRVCPLLFDGIEPHDVKGPLAQFQAAAFSKEELRRVLRMINSELEDAALAPDLLDTVFEMWWPKLENALDDLPRDGKQDKPIRSEKEMLGEILNWIREQSRGGLREEIETFRSEIIEKIRNQSSASDDLTLNTELKISRLYRFQAAGLIDIRDRMDPDIEMGFGEAAREIRILQTWIPDFVGVLNQLEKALARGCHVRLLLLSPKSKFTSIRSSEVGFPSENQVADLIRGNIRDLRVFCQQNPEMGQRVELRVYDGTPVISLYASDDVYTLGLFWRERRAVQGPQFIVQGVESHLAKTIDAHFDSIWHSAVSQSISAERGSEEK